MKVVQFFFKCLVEYSQIKYELKCNYWRYRAELEIYKQDKLKSK